LSSGSATSASAGGGILFLLGRGLGGVLFGRLGGGLSGGLSEYDPSGDDQSDRHEAGEEAFH
jgi:hypothetical protein